MDPLLIISGVCFLIFLFLLPFGIAAQSLAPWVPTKKKDLSRILELANLKESDVFYEIGSGNGRVMLYVRDNSDVGKVVGIECVLTLVLISRLQLFFKKRKNTEVRHENCFECDFGDATHVFVFGMPDKINSKLCKKIKDTCKPGTFVISHVFAFNDLRLVKISKPTENDLPIYLYQL